MYGVSDMFNVDYFCQHTKIKLSWRITWVYYEKNRGIYTISFNALGLEVTPWARIKDCFLQKRTKLFESESHSRSTKTRIEKKTSMTEARVKEWRGKYERTTSIIMINMIFFCCCSLFCGWENEKQRKQRYSVALNL